MSKGLLNYSCVISSGLEVFCYIRAQISLLLLIGMISIAGGVLVLECPSFINELF